MPRRLLLAALLAAACSTSSADDEPPPPQPKAAPAAANGRVAISVTEKGFEPSPIQVARGKPLTLVVTRKTDKTCAVDLTIPEHKIDVKLPLGKPVEITFTPTRSGQLVYGCSMDHMISGVLQVR